MTLVRWNPIRDFSVLHNQMNRLFEDAMGTWLGESNGRGNTNWVPLADIYENDNDLIVRAELPGVDPEMVDLRVERTTSLQFAANGRSSRRSSRRIITVWSDLMGPSLGHSPYLQPSTRTRSAPNTGTAFSI